MCGFSLSVALKRLFLRCLASLYIVKKFLLYSNFSNYKCACAYAKIQISVRMPSDVHTYIIIHRNLNLHHKCVARYARQLYNISKLLLEECNALWGEYVALAHMDMQQR